MLQSEDTFLRLPCDEDLYERQATVDTPYFQNNIIDPVLGRAASPSRSLGPMAYLVEISSHWGDVLRHIYRSSYQSAQHYHDDYNAFYYITNQKLSSWMKNLPPQLTDNASDANFTLSKGTISIFIKLHTLYYATIIKLNRNIRYAHLSAPCVARNIRAAIKHAWQLLQMMQTFQVAQHERTSPSPSLSPKARHQEPQTSCSLLAGSTPFAGYAIFTAIDILSAGGSLERESFTSMMKAMKAGLDIVDELSQCWASATAQRKAIRRRIEVLAQRATEDATEGKIAWKCKEAMDTTLGVDQDVFYADSADGIEMLLEPLGLEAKGDNILFVR